MKEIVWVFILGLFLSPTGWAMDSDETLSDLAEEEVQEEEAEPKFSELVKSTMDLMGPEQGEKTSLDQSEASL